MTQIIEHLKDPAWWFSAFFIAIIASVIAGFVKDNIQALVSNISSKEKQRQEKRSADLERTLVALENNGNLIIILTLRAVLAKILMMSSIFIFLAVSSLSANEHPYRTLLSLFFIFSGLMSVIISYKAMKLLRIVTLAFHRYFEKHKVPYIE